MKIGQAVLTVFIAVFLIGDGSNAQMYKYVDENGVVTFQDHPPEKITPDTDVKVLQTIKGESRKGKLPRQKSAEPPPIKKAEPLPDNSIYEDAQVELFVTSWCKYCKKAEDYFRSKGVRFTTYDIEKDKAAARRKNKLSPRKGVPFAIVNGRQIYGFAPQAYEKALNNP